MMTCWPQALVRPAATKRASTSGVEPGGASEMMATGISGYLIACACAAGASDHANRHGAAMASKKRAADMASSGLSATRLAVSRLAVSRLAVTRLWRNKTLAQQDLR